MSVANRVGSGFFQDDLWFNVEGSIAKGEGNLQVQVSFLFLGWPLDTLVMTTIGAGS